MLKRFKRFRAAEFGPANGLIFIVFCLGTAAGTVIGSALTSPILNTELAAYIESSVLSDSFFSSIYNAFFFTLLAVLFGTSFLGVFLIPSAVLIKAYSMSCSVAVMYSSFGFKGTVCALFFIGIPSLLIIPCFILCAIDALNSARQLYSIRFHSAACAVENQSFFRHMIFVIPALALAALYDNFLLPLILSHIY